jgi:hypothetical protein
MFILFDGFLPSTILLYFFAKIVSDLVIRSSFKLALVSFQHVPHLLHGVLSQLLVLIHIMTFIFAPPQDFYQGITTREPVSLGRVVFREED